MIEFIKEVADSVWCHPVGAMMTAVCFGFGMAMADSINYWLTHR